MNKKKKKENGAKNCLQNGGILRNTIWWWWWTRKGRNKMALRTLCTKWLHLDKKMKIKIMNKKKKKENGPKNCLQNRFPSIELVAAGKKYPLLFFDDFLAWIDRSCFLQEKNHRINRSRKIINLPEEIFFSSHSNRLPEIVQIHFFFFFFTHTFTWGGEFHFSALNRVISIIEDTFFILHPDRLFFHARHISFFLFFVHS